MQERATEGTLYYAHISNSMHTNADGQWMNQEVEQVCVLVSSD